MKKQPDISNYDPSIKYTAKIIEATRLTQTELARRLGVTDRAIRYWADGSRRMPYTVQYCIESLAMKRSASPVRAGS